MKQKNVAINFQTNVYLSNESNSHERGARLREFSGYGVLILLGC